MRGSPAHHSLNAMHGVRVVIKALGMVKRAEGVGEGLNFSQ